MMHAQVATAGREPMDETQLLALLKGQADDAATYHSSEIATHQAEALERFFAEPYGDEVDGWSKHVSHDLEDAVNAIMPDLMRHFTSSDELIVVDDRSMPDNAELFQLVEDYLAHVFFRDNDGERLIHDFAFDGLVQRLGVMRVQMAARDPKTRIVEGLPPQMVEGYDRDPEYEILAVEMGSDGLYAIQVRHTPPHRRCVIDVVPPEHFRVSSRARSLADADYHACIDPDAYLLELIREHPEHEAELIDMGGHASGQTLFDGIGDPRIDARHGDDFGIVGFLEDDVLARRQVEVRVEYIRVDYDGDGVVELRRIKRVADIILENDAVDRSEFVAWTPARVSHKLYGRSFHDQIGHLQRAKSQLIRLSFDSLSSALQPRIGYNKEAVGDDSPALDSLLDHQRGDVIGVRGNPSDVFLPLMTPDVSPSALTWLEYIERKSEEGSGVTKHSQGINPEAITQTASGIAMLQAAAGKRTEQVARWLGVALGEVFELILHNLVLHQGGVRMLRLSGHSEPIMIDPRLWSDEMRVTVHVGTAGESRDARLAKLQGIASLQREIFTAAGDAQPLVTWKHIAATASEMAATMGFRNTERFFASIPDDWQPPQQELQPDPQLIEVQGKMQLDAQKAQADQQRQAAELEFKRQVAGMEEQRQQAAAQFRLEAEREIAIMRLAQERELAELRMAQEAQLARERMQHEARLASMRTPASAPVNGSAVKLSKNRAGGSLDA